jgi:hypothetical protein
MISVLLLGLLQSSFAHERDDVVVDEVEKKCGRMVWLRNDTTNTFTGVLSLR